MSAISEMASPFKSLSQGDLYDKNYYREKVVREPCKVQVRIMYVCLLFMHIDSMHVFIMLILICNYICMCVYYLYLYMYNYVCV